MPDRKDYLKNTIQHIDITRHNVVPLVESMQHMAFSSRDLARAADIYDRMQRNQLRSSRLGVEWTRDAAGNRSNPGLPNLPQAANRSA